MHTRPRSPPPAPTPLCTGAVAPCTRYEFACICVRRRAPLLQGPPAAGGAVARRIPGPARSARSRAGCVPTQLCIVFRSMFSMCVPSGGPWKAEPKPRDPARQVHPLVPEVRRFLSRAGLSGLVGRPRVMPCGACMSLLMRTHAYNPIHACKHPCTQIRAWSVVQARSGRRYACGEPRRDTPDTVCLHDVACMQVCACMQAGHGVCSCMRPRVCAPPCAVVLHTGRSTTERSSCRGGVGHKEFVPPCPPGVGGDRVDVSGPSHSELCLFGVPPLLPQSSSFCLRARRS